MLRWKKEAKSAWIRGLTDPSFRPVNLRKRRCKNLISSSRNPFIVWRHLRGNLENGGRVSRRQTKARYSVRAANGRVARTSSERVVSPSDRRFPPVESRPPKCERCSRTADRHTTEFSPSTVNARARPYLLLLQTRSDDGLQPSCQVRICRGGAEKGKNLFVNLHSLPYTTGRWHSWHPDLVNLHPTHHPSPL